MVKYIYLILLFWISISVMGQQKFRVEIQETDTWRDIYILKNEQNAVIKVLDSAKYYFCSSGHNLGYFAVFGVKESKQKNGWTAIDSNEKVLFYVYNYSFGEPSPDFLVEDKLRIVDENGKIGYANREGKIIIKPQFEIASPFFNGKAIIAMDCKRTPMDKHEHTGDCNHSYLVCKQHGYINEKGEIIKLGHFTYQEIQKEIGWKEPEEY